MKWLVKFVSPKNAWTKEPYFDISIGWTFWNSCNIDIELMGALHERLHYSDQKDQHILQQWLTLNLKLEPTGTQCTKQRAARWKSVALAIRCAVRHERPATFLFFILMKLPTDQMQGLLWQMSAEPEKGNIELKHFPIWPLHNRFLGCVLML